MANNFSSLFEIDEPDPISIINETLLPHVDSPFQIVPDGTKQTELANTGRMGFWVERQFGIKPNNDQSPDRPWGEIKSICCDNFKSCSIGTISRNNWSAIEQGFQDHWLKSFANQKMKSTLFVFYSKAYASPESHGPEYTIKRYGLYDISKLANMLQPDWARIVKEIKSSTGYGNALHTGEYINLTYKGDAQYVYPSLSFKGNFVRDMYNLLD